LQLGALYQMSNHALFVIRPTSLNINNALESTEMQNNLTGAITGDITKDNRTGNGRNESSFLASN